MISKNEIAAYFRLLQDHICGALEKADGKAKFEEDRWQREGGGGGRSRVIQDGSLFEKGGVNFSEVHGKAPDFMKEKHDDAPGTFYATGVSIVIHPLSPMIPIIHLNVRYLELGNRIWFGGGIDLTPVYFHEEDVRFFHRQLKSVCDRFSPEFYPRFKSWADDYFYIVHRNETRGAGGIFFDHLEPDTEFPLNRLFEFVKAVGESFVPVYLELVSRNRDAGYGEKEKQWQSIRRGRYAEFNLVYDRGTKFGLETGGRTESILMSLPPLAAWKYDYRPDENSDEARTLGYLKKAIGWI